MGTLRITWGEYIMPPVSPGSYAYDNEDHPLYHLFLPRKSRYLRDRVHKSFYHVFAQNV
jgi:hypothetical protein